MRTLTQVSVIMLGTRNLERAVAFYHQKLGMRLNQQIPGLAFLNGGGVTLALSEPLARARETVAGATEVVFPVDNVKQAFGELKSQGVEFVNEPRVVNGPMWAANFKDPDGHFLSIFGPEGGTAGGARE